MERFTKYGKTTHENGVCCTHFNSKECHEVVGNCAYGCKWEELAWSKLAEYEDLEEQGLLWILPCAPNTEVHKIINNTDACSDCEHYSDFYGMDSMCSKGDIIDIPRYADKPICEKQFLEIFTFVAELDYICSHRKDFGKTIFLTKEDAEAALAEMGE